MQPDKDVMMISMWQSIDVMSIAIADILQDNNPSIFLYGSIVDDDFKLGWSDIDILCLTEKAIQAEKAEKLVELRQSLMLKHPQNPYFRLFEGGMLTLDAFINNTADMVVYWGTSGQRITDNYALCPFGKMVLLENGKLLYGSDCRSLISYPIKSEVVDAINAHYKTIRQHGKRGAGWLMDIARCLYTLETNKVISKTKAAEWVIAEKLCPNADVMKKAVEFRKNPLEFQDCEKTKQWQASLEPQIQEFADVLEKELQKFCLK